MPVESFLHTRAANHSQTGRRGAERRRRQQGQHDHSRNYNIVLGKSEIMMWLVDPHLETVPVEQFTLSKIQIENGEKED